MTCSIVIPTMRRAQILAMTLDSLALQSEKNFQVIVICDGEDPQTRALAESYTARYPLHWIFTVENHGLPSARNAGAYTAKGDVLLFLDDDTSAAHDFVSLHRQHHEAHSTDNGLVVYGGLVHDYLHEPNSHTERFLRRDREQAEGGADGELARLSLESIELDHWYRWCGVNCSISRTTFLKYRGNNPVLRDISEDREFGNRLYDGGVQFLSEPRALTYHHQTKQLSEYFSVGCEIAGRVEAQLALKMGHRNGMTRGLVAVQRQGLLRRLKLRWYWDRPETVRVIAEIARKVTDATGSRLAYQVWRRAETARNYWQGVKSNGLTLEELRGFVGKPLPVLAFPTSSLPRDSEANGHTPSPQRLKRALRTLRKLKYVATSPAEGLSSGIKGRCAVFMFDGYEDFVSEVYPHLRTYGMKPLVFVAAGRLGGVSNWAEQNGTVGRRWLTVEQIHDLQGQGVQFGSYGLTHAWLPGLPDAELYREVVDSKACLEDMLGSEVTCFAYPGGGVDQRVRAAVARAGYQFGFSRRVGLNFWDDHLALKRITVNEGDNAINLAVMVATGRSITEHLPVLIRRMLGVG